jgi:cell division septation protein DedD
MSQHYIHVRRLPTPFPVVELNWAKVQVDLATQIGCFSSYDSVKNLVDRRIGGTKLV